MWRVARLVTRWRRLPRAVLHAAPLLFLGPCVAANLEHTDKLAHGKAAEAALDPRCCANVPRPLRGTARWIDSHLGNPFAFPANVIFALRHGVPVTRWDRIVGNYPITPGLYDIRGDRLWSLHGVWRVGSPHLRQYLVGGWSASFSRDQRLFRLTMSRSATVLVPNLLPYGQRVTVWLAPAGASHVRLRWNGDVVAEAELSSGWQRIRFDLPDIDVHTNELAIESDLGPLRDADLPNVIVPVGVAVGDIELAMLRPPSSPER